MTEPPIALIIAVSVLLFVAITGATLYFMRDLFGPLLGMLRSKVIAEAEVEPGEPRPFTLRHLVEQSRPFRVCLKLVLFGPRRLGIRCDYQVTVGGQVVTKEVIGYGREAPSPFDRLITRTFFSVESHSMSSSKQRGTIILTEVEPCAPGAEIVVQGIVGLNPSTQAGTMSVSLRG